MPLTGLCFGDSISSTWSWFWLCLEQGRARFGEPLQGAFPSPTALGLPSCCEPQAAPCEAGQGIPGVQRLTPPSTAVPSPHVRCPPHPCWDLGVFCRAPQPTQACRAVETARRRQGQGGAVSVLAREKGSSPRAFLQVPFACACCSLCGFSLPSRYEALFRPRGLRLPAASLGTEMSTPRGAVPQSWSLLGDGAGTPAHPHSRLPAAGVPRGPGHGREVCFHGVKTFYFINYSTKTDSFAGALNSCYLSSCLSVGVGAADLLFWPL